MEWTLEYSENLIVVLCDPLKASLNPFWVSTLPVEKHYIRPSRLSCQPESHYLHRETFANRNLMTSLNDTSPWR